MQVFVSLNRVQLPLLQMIIQISLIYFENVDFRYKNVGIFSLFMCSLHYFYISVVRNNNYNAYLLTQNAKNVILNIF